MDTISRRPQTQPSREQQEERGGGSGGGGGDSGGGGKNETSRRRKGEGEKERGERTGGRVSEKGQTGVGDGEPLAEGTEPDHSQSQSQSQTAEEQEEEEVVVEVVDISKRIGPWHPPDYQRQRVLADRLSNPALRSSRPGTSTTVTSSSQNHHQDQQQEENQQDNKKEEVEEEGEKKKEETYHQQQKQQQLRRRHRTLPPFLQHSPYYHRQYDDYHHYDPHSDRRRAHTADARNPRMNPRASSSGNSPRNPQSTSSASSSSPRHPNNNNPNHLAIPGSPRRRPNTSSSSSAAHYGAVSPRRQPPLFPTPATTRRVTEEELDEIVGRITKPTVSSRGGEDLKDKDFTYIPTPRLKTLPVVPGLERRYLGLQKVDSARMEEIVGRLTRLTSAYKAKFAPNGNVYVDMEPGAHMVHMQRSGARSARSAV